MARTDSSVRTRPWRWLLLSTVVSAASIFAIPTAAAAATPEPVLRQDNGTISVVRPARNENGDLF
jgi:hypothetical protein